MLLGWAKRVFKLVRKFIKVSECSIDVTAFRNTLIEWGKEYFRPFPWRLTEDPYHILIAEVMLHRTQANQVILIYKRFIENYPSLALLARANKEEIIRLLYPLGLHWRIELMRDMVIKLITSFNGQVPRNKADLLLLPGVSEYISSAVRCFAWNISEPIIDTNTVRVVGRLFGLEIKDSSRRNPLFRKLITALVDQENPKQYNYALLDLAELICTKRRPPSHTQCPVFKWCWEGIKK